MSENGGKDDGPDPDPSVCEEETALQCKSVNLPTSSDPAQASSHQTYQTTCSGLQLIQQEVQPTLCGLPTTLPSLPPNAPSGCTPASTQVTSPSGTPVEEHTRDLSAAVLVSGRRPLVLDGLPLLVGDTLFMEWTAVPYSVTREDNC